MFWKPKQPQTPPVTYRLKVGAIRYLGDGDGDDVIVSLCWVTLDRFPERFLSDEECTAIVRHERHGWRWSGCYSSEVTT